MGETGVVGDGKETGTLGAVKAAGLVFGDIGTSPIYTLTVILALIPRTEAAVLGVLSLIIWTLILIVSVQYAWLAMSLGKKKGEGGTIVLRELLNPLLKHPRSRYALLILTVIGVSLLIGDGVITPAISILSAVEGVPLIPGLKGWGRTRLSCSRPASPLYSSPSSGGAPIGSRSLSGRSWSSGLPH